MIPLQQKTQPTVAGAGVGIYVSDVAGVTINNAFDIDVYIYWNS
jgi:hypothetical protein